MAALRTHTDWHPTPRRISVALRLILLAALVPTPDNRAACADLTQLPTGSSYRWTVNGVLSGKGVVATTFYLTADGDLVTVQGEGPQVLDA